MLIETGERDWTFGNFVLSDQFFCKSETAVKNQVYSSKASTNA